MKEEIEDAIVVEDATILVNYMRTIGFEDAILLHQFYEDPKFVKNEKFIRLNFFFQNNYHVEVRVWLDDMIMLVMYEGDMKYCYSPSDIEEAKEELLKISKMTYIDDE